MNNKPPFEDGEPLGKLLREWRVDAPLPPRFQERVWGQIAKAEARLGPSWWVLAQQWVETTLPRPALATAYLATLLLLGMGAGYQQGHMTAAHAKSESQARYIQMVDPYQTPR